VAQEGDRVQIARGQAREEAEEQEGCAKVAAKLARTMGDIGNDVPRAFYVDSQLVRQTACIRRGIHPVPSGKLVCHNVSGR
jgi:hypothetical protein